MSWHSIDESWSARLRGRSHGRFGVAKSRRANPLRPISRQPRPIEWRSINESPAVVRPRPVPARTPEPKWRRPQLMTIVAWGLSLLAHEMLAFVLVCIILGNVRPDDPPEEKPYVVGLRYGDGGEEGTSLKEIDPDIPIGKEDKKGEEKKKEEPKSEESKKIEPKKEEPKPEPPKEEPKKEEPVVKKDGDSPKPESSTSGTSAEPKDEKSSIGVGGGSGSSKDGRPKNDNSKEIEKDATQATRTRRAGAIKKLRAGGDKSIVVVGGAYDSVEQVLSKLEIPYTKIDPDELGSYDLGKCAILLVNCHSAYANYADSGGLTPEKAKEESDRLQKQIDDLDEKFEKRKKEFEDHPEKLKDDKKIKSIMADQTKARQSKAYYDKMHEVLLNKLKMITNIRTFVEKGGFLFTSDWGITVLEKCFPGMVKNGGSVGPKTVTIVPSKGAEKDPLLEEVFLEKKGAARNLRWVIDSTSYPIKVVSREVVTLVESSQLAGNKAVVVVFKPEMKDTEAKPGKILHVLSHFYRQEDNFGEYALQNLLLNFMIARVGTPTE